MERDKSLHSGQAGKLEGVPDTTVTKPDPCLVFVIRILRVMNEDVGSFREPVSGGPFSVIGKGPGAKCRFMVRQIGQGCASALDAVSDGRVGMDDKLCLDGEIPDLDDVPGKFMKMKVCRKIPHIDWEKRWG